MTATDVLFTYIIPFLITTVILGLNEYRLFRNKRISYETAINSIAMMIISLIAFIIYQAILTTKF